MGVRENRLQAEYDTMQKFRSQVVSWEAIGNSVPVDEYLITYDLKSIVGFKDKEPQYHKGFTVQIKFPPDYPRNGPEVRPLSRPYPLHPNIWVDRGFCLEGTQHWIPGIGVALDSLCQMIGEIIAFQHVNLSSPANGDGTLDTWIRANLKIINKTTVTNPIDPSPIRLPDLEDAIRWGSDKPSQSGPRIKFG